MRPSADGMSAVSNGREMQGRCEEAVSRRCAHGLRTQVVKGHCDEAAGRRCECGAGSLRCSRQLTVRARYPTAGKCKDAAKKPTAGGVSAVCERGWCRVTAMKPSADGVSAVCER